MNQWCVGLRMRVRSSDLWHPCSNLECWKWSPTLGWPALLIELHLYPQNVGVSPDEPMMVSIEIKIVWKCRAWIDSYQIIQMGSKYVIGDTVFTQTISKVYNGQLLQQALVLDINYVVYVSASETSIIFTCVIYIPCWSIVFVCSQYSCKISGEIGS